MLISNNIHPQKSIYYNGSFVLKVISETKKQRILDLYLDIREDVNMTFPVFVLCLDWLFLLNLVTMDDRGYVCLCF